MLKKKWVSKRQQSHSYVPDFSLPPDKWLELDEDSQIDLVATYHRRARIRLPNARLHTAFHVVVENQIASGEPAVLRALERLLADGLGRHDATHAIASVLSAHIFVLLKGERMDATVDPNLAYFEQLESLTAASWVSEYGRLEE